MHWVPWLYLCIFSGPFFCLKDAIFNNLTVSWLHLPFRAASHGNPTTVSWIKWSLLLVHQDLHSAALLRHSPQDLELYFMVIISKAVTNYHVLPHPFLSLFVNSRIQPCITPGWPIQYCIKKLSPKSTRSLHGQNVQNLSGRGEAGRKQKGLTNGLIVIWSKPHFPRKLV